MPTVAQGSKAMELRDLASRIEVRVICESANCQNNTPVLISRSGAIARRRTGVLSNGPMALRLEACSRGPAGPVVTGASFEGSPKAFYHFAP